MTDAEKLLAAQLADHFLEVLRDKDAVTDEQLRVAAKLLRKAAQ